MQTDYQHYQHMHGSLHDRCFPHRVMDDIWLWSVFSDEKEIHFNGYLIKTGPDEALIIDPPCGGPEVLDGFAPLPKATMIVLTNADHERASIQFKEKLGIPIYCHESDVALLAHPPDHTYQDGYAFPGGWQAIHLPNQKTPGETALYHAARQILIVGDALIGKPLQHLSMLPDEKYADKAAAVQGLERLRTLAVTTVLPGDGEPVLQNAASMIADALIPHANNHPSRD